MAMTTHCSSSSNDCISHSYSLREWDGCWYALMPLGVGIRCSFSQGTVIVERREGG